MSFLFNELIYQPIYNFLIFVYNIIPLHDFGIAIILVTIIIKAVLIPLSRKQIESQKKMQEMQPRIKELQEKHKGDKEKQSRALMEFYKENKVNPFSGCLPLIVQLIVLIAIYRVLFNISQNNLMADSSLLYSFVQDPGQINRMFLNIIDLSAVLKLGSLALTDIPQIILIVAAALLQYVQSKMLMAKQVFKPKKDGQPDFSQMMTKQMLYMGPLLTLFIGIKFPAGLALYWLVSTLFMIIQQRYIIRKEDEKAIN